VRIQFKAMGERPSTTKSNLIAAQYILTQSPPINRGALYHRPWCAGLPAAFLESLLAHHFTGKIACTYVHFVFCCPNYQVL
jgi:hypothetical protein